MRNIVLAAFCLLTTIAAGPAGATELPGVKSEHGPHHVSVFIGNTELVDSDHSGFTLGIDYEYRVSEFLGLGFVGERAFGGVDATTLLLVADLHLWRGLIAQVGPGIEIVDSETHTAARFGLLYEFELENGITVSPQLHYDVSHEDGIVFGLAVGRAF